LLIVTLSVLRSKVTSLEVRKTFVRHILQVLKSLDKYILLCNKSPDDQDLKLKVKHKIPTFEKAISKLKAKRASFRPKGTDTGRSSCQNGEFTLAFNSTMNDYSNINEGYNNTSHIEDHSYKNYMGAHDSFTKSVRTLFNSIKTDNFSKKSDHSLFQDLKQNALLNNESFIDEKFSELDGKLRTLKKFSV
jgi:hypothetical protein